MPVVALVSYLADMIRAPTSYQEIVQKFMESLGTVWVKSNKKHKIERLKTLGAIVFEGSTNPADDEAWLSLLKKCFEVTDCPEKRKIKLPTFLLHKQNVSVNQLRLVMRDTYTMT